MLTTEPFWVAKLAFFGEKTQGLDNRIIITQTFFFVLWLASFL
jgi:hypothetical protein